MGNLTVLGYISWQIIKTKGFKELGVGGIISIVFEEFQKMTSNMSRNARRHQSRELSKTLSKSINNMSVD